MSSTITAAQRRRNLPACLQSFLCPSVFAGHFRRAGAASSAARFIAAGRGQPAGGREPNPGQADLSIEDAGSRRAAPAVLDRQPRSRRPIRTRVANAHGTTAPARQFAGIVGASTDRHHRRRYRALAGTTLPEIIAQVPGVQLQTLYGGVGGAGTSVDLRGFGAFATANTLLLINGRTAQRHRPAGRGPLDHPTQLDRAH